MANRLNGEVAFPPLEGKAVLRFTLEDQIGLEECFQAAYEASIKGIASLDRYTFHGWLMDQLFNLRPKVLMTCLSVGLKELDGETRYKDFNPKTASFPLQQIVRPIQDALNLSVMGKTYTELIQEQIEKEEALAGIQSAIDQLTPPADEVGDENPPESPEI
jgi:hypothetical protein